MQSVQHNNINFTDNRRHSRHDCNIRGKVKIGSTTVINCILKDISIGGARLVFPAGSWIPSEFSLELPNGFPPISAKKVWLENDSVGIKF